MNEYNEQDLEELLRLRLQNRAGTPLVDDLGVDTSFVTDTMGIDPSRAMQPEYPMEFLGGLARGAESVTDAPRRAAMAEGMQGENPLSAFASQFAENPDDAPTQSDLNEIAKLRLQRDYPQMAAMGFGDVAGVPDFDVPALKPMAAIGEIRKVIPGGRTAQLAATEKLAKLSKKEFLPDDIVNKLRDELRYIDDKIWHTEKYSTTPLEAKQIKPLSTRKKEIEDIINSQDEMFRNLRKQEELEKRLREESKTGISYDSFKNQGKLRPAASKRTRQEILNDLRASFPKQYTNKQLKNENFLNDEIKFWSKETQRGYPDAAETVDFLQSELSKIKPPNRGKLKGEYLYEYKIDSSKNPIDKQLGHRDDMDSLKITVYDKNRTKVGSFSFHNWLEKNKLEPWSANVDKNHRRKGIATEAYKLAEKVFGKKLEPSTMQSKDAKALWKTLK